MAADMENTTYGGQGGIDWDNMGEQPGGGYRGALPPGDYEFKLPTSLKESWTKEFEANDPNSPPDSGKKVKRQSLFPELVITHSRDAAYVGETRKMMIGGLERNRAGKKAPKPRIVSDLMYLYRDALKGEEKPTNFPALKDAIGRLAPGKRFTAAVEWTATCDKKNVRYIYGPDATLIQDPEGKLGCGNRYYQNSTGNQAIPKEDGQPVERFLCSCGASLRCFDQLTRFRPAQAEGGAA